MTELEGQRSPEVPEEALSELSISPKKRTINIVFIGHVDAGKSTIGGQILYQAGKVDKRTLEKYERESREKNRESWYLSWTLDSNPEEREKGITTELGYASFEVDAYNVQILDAPGHKMYVPNMIQGVNQADVAILVISARQNEFEAGFEKGGQTREHVFLAKASGLSKVCVLINKMDDISVSWAKERFDYIVASTSKMMGALFGKENVSYIPVSGFVGDNIKEPVDKAKCSWYAGPTFFDYLSALEIEWRSASKLVANVTDTVKEMGNFYVLARVERGALARGETVKIMPGSRKALVQTILGREDEEAADAESGENVKLRLKDVDEGVAAGDMIVDVEYDNVKDTNVFMAHLSILEAKNLICKGYSPMMHMGARTVQVQIGDMYQKEGDKVKRVKFAKTGQKVVCEIIVAGCICVEEYAQRQRTGVFTLRDEGKTVGFGRVLRVKPKK